MLETSMEPKEEDVPIPTNKPLSGGTKDGVAPSWADFMKQIEQEEASNPKEPVKSTVKKSPVKKPASKANCTSQRSRS